MLYGVNDVSLLTGKTTWMEIQDALLSRAVQLSNERFQFFQKLIPMYIRDFLPFWNANKILITHLQKSEKNMLIPFCKYSQ